MLDRDMDEPDSTGQHHGEVKLSRLPEDLKGQISEFLRNVRNVSPETVPDRQRRNQILLTVMKRVFESRMRQYTTSYTHDFGLLSQKKVAGRQMMAIAVRWGEKVLLNEAINLAKETLQEMNMDEMELEPDPVERAAKKPRTR